MNKRVYDTIVVGLGALGAATLYQLAKSGQRVLGIDRYTPPHAHGSTHGETRITRCAIGEGVQYVALAQRSHAIWRELETETGLDLLHQTGLLILANPATRAEHHGKPHFLQSTIAIAERCAIPHEVLDAASLAQRYRQLKLTGAEIGYFEPGAGYVDPERCVEAQLAVAARFGAELLFDTRVTAMTRDGMGGATVVTASGDRFAAATIVLAAGAWTPGLLGGPYPRHLSVQREAMHWYEVEDPAAFTPERFPPFIWMHGDVQEDYLYGFPLRPGTTGLKLGTERYTAFSADPEAIAPATDDEAATTWRRHVEPQLRGVRATCLRSLTCMYTVTPDGDFLVDRAQDNEHVLVVSACSGHGFKHSAGMGEALARQVVTGAVVPELAPFAGARLPGAHVEA